MSLTNFKKVCIFRFDIFALMGLIFILCALGRWQLHRAWEKQTIVQQFEHTQQLPERLWHSGGPNPPSFQRIKVQGALAKQVFYLDNQFHGHQVGYELFVPIRLASHEILLVDVGWLPMGAQRHPLPRLHLEHLNTWRGSVYYPKMTKVDLGHFLDYQQRDNYLIERLDTQKIGGILSTKVMPWILKTSLSRGSIVSVSPQKHYAYALQWFVMAFGVLILLIWRLVKK